MPILKFLQTVISGKYKQCKLEQQWVQNQKSAFSHGPLCERLWEKKVLKTPTHLNDWTLTTVEIMMLGSNFQNSPLCLMQVVWEVLAHIFSTCLAFACKCFHRPNWNTKALVDHYSSPCKSRSIYTGLFLVFISSLTEILPCWLTKNECNTQCSSGKHILKCLKK